MTQTHALKVGDKVTHKNNTWSGPATIKKIVRLDRFIIAFFEEGGWWRVSELKEIS